MLEKPNMFFSSILFSMTLIGCMSKPGSLLNAEKETTGKRPDPKELKIHRGNAMTTATEESTAEQFAASLGLLADNQGDNNGKINATVKVKKKE